MARVHYRREELQSLLQLTSEEVHSVLLASPPHVDSIFFQNFTTIALKAVKYLTASINLVSPDQTLGRIVDRLVQGFTSALQEYRSRNIFVHSVHSPSQASSREDLQKEDQIYHFMNTRNNLLPVECLSTYENDRQRKELEEFVEEMKKHQEGGSGKREHKRSLMLPKDHNFQLKIGRKRTFDPEPLPSHHFKPLPQKKEPEAPPPPPEQTVLIPPAYQNVETQTQSHILATSQIIVQQKQDQRSQLQVPSQVLSGVISEAILSTLSHNQLGVPQKKEKKKGLMDSDGKNKKKTKFAASNQTIIKAEPTPINTSKSLGKKKLLLPPPTSQCSLKLVKLNEKVLSMCSKEVDLTVGKTDEITIHINYTTSQNQLPLAALSSAIILDADTIPTIHSQHTSDSHPTGSKIETQDKIIADAISALMDEKEGDIHGDWEGVEGRKKYLLAKSKQNVKESQRIPISTVKISAEDSNEPSALHHFARLRQTESFLINEGSAKVNIKRKKYTGDRHLFSSFIISQTEGDHNLSYHLRTSKLNILPFEGGMDPLLMKKESDCSNDNKQKSTHKFPSFSKNEPQSLSSSLSHDYLASQERSDPKQLLHRLMQLQRDQQQQGKSLQKRDTPTFNRTASNCSEDPNKETQGGGRGRGRESQMIRISNAHRLNEDLVNQLAQGHSRFFQNNRIASDMQKETSKEPEKHPLPLPLPQKHPSFLKKNHLSLIPQNQRTDACETVMNKSSLDSLNRTTLDVSQSIPHKSVFYRQSTEILPVRVPMGKLKVQGRVSNINHCKSLSPHHVNKPQSSSAHTSGSFEAQMLRRKLRGRGNKDKLEHYLDLIQATHLKFCGKDCEHLKELLEGKEGSISDQIVRLVKRLK